MANRLFIIEAPGKELILARILFQIFKQHSEIIATIGHICSNPVDLNSDWINSDLKENNYNVLASKTNIIQKIKLAASIADEIYLATDDDNEGDVIARDVVSHALEDVNSIKLFRVKLRAMTVEEVRRALTERQLFVADANKGDARRVLDRLIGSLSSEKGAVGRVQGSMLIELGSKSPVIGLMTLRIPSFDGESEFIGQLPVFPHEKPLFDELNDLCEKCVLMSGTTVKMPSSQTWNYSDIILNTSLQTGRTAKEIASAMQHLYENGALTYPRSSQRNISTNTLQRTQVIARMQGVTFKPEIVVNLRKNQGKGHEAPSILENDIPLNREVDNLTDTESALKILIARNQVETGLPCEISLPTTDSLERLPSLLQNINWMKKNIVGHCLWIKKSLPQCVAWTPQQSLLHFMQQTNLGRPSTLVGHIEKFISRDLADINFDLTTKGKIWFDNQKDIFHNKNISNIIEAYLDKNNDAPELMVKELIDICHLDTLKNIGVEVDKSLDSQDNINDEFTTYSIK
jgi:DNA topoisomerase-1